MKKTVTVLTDDPENSEIPLTVTGKVIEIYTLSAKSVKLKGSVGEHLEGIVRLFPSEAYPFKIQKISAKRGKNIRFELEEIEEKGKSGYKITVENTLQDKGIYFDTLYLDTDSDKKAQITISVVGKILEAETTPDDGKEG